MPVYGTAVPRRSGVITVVNADASGYRFPPDQPVDFLLDPSGAATLSAVVSGLETSLKEAPRRVIVANFNPVPSAVLDISTVPRPLRHARHGTTSDSAL